LPALAAALAGATALPLAGGARAWQGDMRAARVHYPHITGSAIDRCALCHVSQSDLGLDPYGRDYHEHQGDFAAIEALDSDGDGFTNLQEILALTFPGKADSRPDPTATDLPPPTMGPTDEPGDPTATRSPTAAPTPSVTPETAPTAVFLPWAANGRR